jgi:hypothetical protein
VSSYFLFLRTNDVENRKPPRFRSGGIFDVDVDKYVLFTDFAPLFSLFGDDVTKQFLSTSIGRADDILLGIAPVGIPTIII